MKTVILKRYNNVQFEAIANEAITPGSLVEVMSTGKIKNHATAQGNAIPYFVIEDAIMGKTINDKVAKDDLARVMVAGRGDEVYAILATSQTILVGDLLASAGGLGALEKFTAIKCDSNASAGAVTTPLQAVAVALEAVTTTSATKRIKVRII
jgi:hypothetical protein